MPREKRRIPWLDTRDGVYHVFWYDPERRRTERLSLRTKDTGEAADRYAAFLTQGRDVYAGVQRSGLTCGAALDYYLDEHVEKGPVVDKQRQRDAVKNLKLFFTDLVVKEIGIPESRTYVERRTGGLLGGKSRAKSIIRKASAGTVKRELNVLQAAIEHCVAWKKPGIVRADIPTLEKPQTKGSKGLWLFQDELQALRTAAADQITQIGESMAAKPEKRDALAPKLANAQKLRDFIDLAYWTAARRHSIERLTVFQVSIPTWRINLGQPDDVETKKRKPVVPVDMPVRDMVKRLVDESTDGTLFGAGYNAWSGFKSLLKKVKLRDLPARDMRPAGKASPHILRHSYATHQLNAGARPKAVADRLGDTVMTVLKVYGHACPDYGDMDAEEGEGS